jgi:hypothetical protein
VGKPFGESSVERPRSKWKCIKTDFKTLEACDMVLTAPGLFPVAGFL